MARAVDEELGLSRRGLVSSPADASAADASPADTLLRVVLVGILPARDSMARANCSGCAGGTVIPPSQRRKTSPMPPTSVTMAGRPADMASNKDIGRPSVSEESAKASALAR